MTYFDKKREIIKIAEEYCQKNGLSLDKLHKQVFAYSEERSIFAERIEESKPDGIKNDMESLPIPTLIVEKNNGKYNVIETESTNMYLM